MAKTKMKTRLLLILIVFATIFLPMSVDAQVDSEDPICNENSRLVNDVCVQIDHSCEPDMYGNIYCDDMAVEDRLTLERFLFEPPIINNKPTVPMGLIIGIVAVIVIGFFAIRIKRK